MTAGGPTHMNAPGTKILPGDARMLRACRDILHEICSDLDSDVIPDQRRVRQMIFGVCSRYKLSRVPKNYEILSVASGVGPDTGGSRSCTCGTCSSTGDALHSDTRSHPGCGCNGTGSLPGHNMLHAYDGDRLRMLRTILLKKPAKTASGVAVVAIMPKPFACPHGRCTYCPGGPEYNTPNSYTGAEPPTLDAMKYEYDPVPQIRKKLDQLRAFGHDVSKTELVIVGGTFLFMPAKYQYDYVKSCYDALNGTDSETLSQAQTYNEHAPVRNVGFTIETKPDYCKIPHIDAMLDYGVTRVEIGVQSLRDRVYEIINRGHTYADVTESFQLAKDAGYKIVSHMMPGLPTMTPQDDIEDFAKLYDDPDLRPDMLKIYPSLVVRGTPLYDQYVAGSYTPYSDDAMIAVLAEAKRRVPKWVRIMRVQREIPPSQIVAGPRQGNLRQLVRKKLRQDKTPCRCIRCREAGLAPDAVIPASDLLHLDHIYYDSSGGQEAFISYVDDSDCIYGFVRLRRPGTRAHRPEVRSEKIHSCIIRELHVYGRAIGVGDAPAASDACCAPRSGTGPAIQHMGLGRRLMDAAERTARDKFGAERMLVISAVGTRQYYMRLGYSLYGPYMAKDL